MTEGRLKNRKTTNQERGFTQDKFSQGTCDFVLEYRRGRFKITEDLCGRYKSQGVP